MNYTDRVFTAMREGKEYSPDELASTCHIPRDSASQILNMLTKHNMIEQTAGGRFIKDRKFKTKQRGLLV
jgi:DNA-binding IclR family transcriptional regulator